MLLVLAPDAARPSVGATVQASLDWERRIGTCACTRRCMSCRPSSRATSPVVRSASTRAGSISISIGERPRQGMGHRRDQQADRAGSSGCAAMGDRRRADGPARAGQDDECASADGCWPSSPRWRSRAIDLQACGGTARRAHRRDRPRRMHQDREQGEDEPALHHRAWLRGKRINGLRKTRCPRQHRMAGCPPRLRLTCVSSMARSTCRRRSATPRPSTPTSTSPVLCSSTSTRSPILENPLPHMLPSPEKFSSRVRKLGLGDGSKIVIYDTTPMTGACRVLVDVPRHGTQGRVDPEWRRAQMAEPKAARSRTIRRRRAIGTSPPVSTIRWCARSTMCAA